MSRPPATKPCFRRTDRRSGDGGQWHEVSRSYPGRPPGLRGGESVSGRHRGRKNEMSKGREESDGRIVPEGLRKGVPNAARRGGKATTAREAVGQPGLFRETADSPQGADGGVDAGRPVPAPCAVPKSRDTKGKSPPAMTMEEVSSEENLMRAFQGVASNKGAPGPDRQGIEESLWTGRSRCCCRGVLGNASTRESVT